MNREAELFVEGKYDELWEHCCSFIDLSIEDFMTIQQRLLAEQLEQLSQPCHSAWELWKITLLVMDHDGDQTEETPLARAWKHAIFRIDAMFSWLATISQDS